MSLRKMLLFFYFILAGVTWVAGGSRILDRLSLADLFMVFMLIYCILHILTARTPLYWRSIFSSSAVFLIIMLLSILYSGNDQQAVVEWLVHVFAVISAFTIYQFVAPLPMSERLNIVRLWILAAAILALCIIYNTIAPTLSLPSIFSPYNFPGAPIGTFRNTGQAGTFMGTALALGLPLLSVCRKKERWLLGAANIVCIVALILTVKRSAMIGFAIGVMLLVISHLRMRNLLAYVAAAVIAVAITVPTMNFLTSTSEQYQRRIDKKLNVDTISGVFRAMLGGGDQSEAGWAQEHYSGTYAAIADNPILGVGVAGVGGAGGAYSTHEVHSTYLKIPATMGISGAIAYCIFMATIFHALLVPQNNDRRTVQFRAVLLPLLVGLVLSWAYTYHLRKREFWITAALAAAVMAPLPRGAVAGYGPRWKQGEEGRWEPHTGFVGPPQRR